MTTGPTPDPTPVPRSGATRSGGHSAPGDDVVAAPGVDPGSPVPHVDPAAAVPGPAAGAVDGVVDATASVGGPGPVGDPAGPAPSAGRRDPAAASTGELLRTLTEDVRAIVRGELASARQEMTEKALAARPAAAMLGGAAVLGVLATGTSAVVVIRFLDRIFPPVTSAVAAAALLGGGAAALARAGLEELRRIGPPVPERTIESVKADVAAVTEATPR